MVNGHKGPQKKGKFSKPPSPGHIKKVNNDKMLQKFQGEEEKTVQKINL